MHNPYDRQLHAEGYIDDFDDAMEFIQQTWVKVHPGCLFVEDEATGTDGDSLTMPRIVYDLAERTHSTEFSDGKKPKVMKSYPDPDYQGHNITENTEWFDCVLELMIFGTTKREAREWKRKLEHFIATYKGHFKKAGIQDIVFKIETRPMVSTTYRQDLPHRSLRYLVRIQRTSIVRSIRVAQLDVEAQTQTRPGVTEPVDLLPGDGFWSAYNQTK